VQQVTGLLGSGRAGDPLPANVLMPVSQLLRDLAGTQGVPAELATLLSQLADTLGGNGSVGGLPVDGLSLPPTLIDQLDDVLSQLENGGRPTARLLAPVGALLDQVAGTPGLPNELSSLLGQLGDSLESTVGVLDPLLTSQLSVALRTIAGTPGLSRDSRTTIERIATLLGGSQSAAGGGSSSGGNTTAATRAARVATARDRAVIKRVSVNRARTRIAVRIACPKSAPASCATAVTAKLGGHKAAQGKHVRIGAGRAKVVRLRMASTARTSSVQHGGRLRVRVTTSFGTRRFAVAKALRLKASTR
jgi:hypothetical protein